MDDLISKQALKEDLLKRGFFPVIVKCALEAAPTVDAVEVVRCKDCMYKDIWYEIDELGARVNICGCSGLYIVEDNDFCSYGERKTNND